MGRYDLTDFEWGVIDGTSVRVHHSAATLKKATQIDVLDEAGAVLLRKSML